MLAEIAPIIIIAVISGFIHGLSGFGSVLVALPLLTLFFDIHTIVPLISLQALCINFTFFIKMRKDVKKEVLKGFFLSAVPGILIGIFVFRKVPGEILKTVLGIIIVLFSIYLLWNRSFKKDLGKVWTIIAGFTAGVLGGSIGANGPPIIIYTAISNWTKDQVKSTITSFLFLAGVLTVSLQVFYGFFTEKVLIFFAFSIPSLVFGMLSGNRCYGILNDRYYDIAVKILLFCLGVTSLVANWDKFMGYFI